MLRERARAAGCLLGHRVTTFPELTDALARDLGAPAHVLEPEMAAVVLARALEAPGIPAALRVPQRGLLHELLRVIAELESAYLAPADVAALAAALPSGASATRLGELGRVYAAYEAELSRIGAVDRHGRERRVCEGLAAAEAAGTCPAALAGVGKIVFAEIYDFSILQFLIATSLIRLVGDAELVAFAHAENVDATRFLDRTWNRFVGDEAIADQVLPSFVERGGRGGSLAAALGGVFATERPAPAAPDGSIRVVVAPSRYREVEAAGRAIRARLERGAPPERIALLARDLAVYGDLIEDVCRRYRIPVYFRKGRPLLANGLVKACLDVVRCVVEGFPRARLEALLDSDYLGAVPPRLARTLRRTGFVAEAARPLADCVAHRLAALAEEGGDVRLPAERRERAAARRARLAEDGARLLAVVETLRGLEGPRTPAGHVRALRRALRALGLRPVPRGALVPATTRRDVRARERLEEALDQLAGLARALGMAAMPLGGFLRLLLAALEPLQVEDAAERTGSVRALGVLDARGLDFDAVYLLGLDDGTFPAPRGESPLWPDAMKREANRAAAERLRRKVGPRATGLPLGGLFRTAREASLEDPFLFFLALSMAEHELVLSYPETNEQGNPTVPSPFLDEVQATAAGPLPRTVLDATALVPLGEECCEPAELVGRASLARWSQRAGAPLDRLTAALAEARPELARRLAAIDRRAALEERRSRYFLCAHDDSRKDALADAFVGRVAVPPELAARLAAMRWTPTRLEALGACGFKFYAREVLGLAPEDDPEAQVGALERGTLAHAVLEALFRAHARLPADLAEARVLGRELVAQTRERAAQTIVAKDPWLFDVAWRRVAAAVDALIVREHADERAWGGTIERIVERPFERALADPDGGPALTLAGTPDRVDLFRDGAAIRRLRVVDYKMSRSPTRYAARIDPARELGKTGFQIPVYLLGALAAVEGLAEGAELSGGYLVLEAEKMPQVRKFPRPLLDDLAARITALVGRARAGRFDVDPEPCDPYCPYRAVCRYQRPPLEEETAGA